MLRVILSAALGAWLLSVPVAASAQSADCLSGDEMKAFLAERYPGFDGAKQVSFDETLSAAIREGIVSSQQVAIQSDVQFLMIGNDGSAKVLIVGLLNGCYSGSGLMLRTRVENWLHRAGAAG